MIAVTSEWYTVFAVTNEWYTVVTVINEWYTVITAPSLDKVYRPDPTRSQEELVYSDENNPSPVAEELAKTYMMHARGTVLVWVTDDQGLIQLRTALEVLYSK